MIKMVDTAVPMNEEGYPVARAKHIWLDDDTNLQKAIDDGLIGGGGDSSVTLTQQEYEALSEEQKLNGLYYAYDTKRIYKNGVQYGASDAEDIGYNNAESGIQATTVQGAIDNVVEKVDGLISDTTSSTTSTWSSKKTSDEIAEVDTKISNNLGELGNLATTEKTNLVGAVNEVANGVGVAKTNPSDKDLNNYKTNGRYTFGSWKQYANAPFETTNGTMLVEDTGAYKTQIAIHRTTGAVKTRLFADNAWSDWRELATMDKVVKYPDWSNQQTISQTEITVDQDVYIELNQLTSSPIDALKINGKDVSVSDAQNGLYSTRFSGYVKKGSFVSYPYLTNPKIVRIFPLV